MCFLTTVSSIFSLLLCLQLVGCRVIPWAKANLNYTAQALIISAGTLYFSYIFVLLLLPYLITFDFLASHVAILSILLTHVCTIIIALMFFGEM